MQEQLKRMKEIDDRLKEIKLFVDDMTVKKSKLTKEMDSLKSEVLSHLEKTGEKDIHTGVCSVKLKQTPAKLIVVDESEIPEQYFTPQPAKLDKRQLLADRKEGEIPGCELSNGGVTLQVTFRDI